MSGVGNSFEPILGVVLVIGALLCDVVKEVQHIVRWREGPNSLLWEYGVCTTAGLGEA